MDRTYSLEVEKAQFELGGRTIHKDLILVNDRTGFYRRKVPRDLN